MQYDESTGFLIHEVNRSSSDSSPGVSTVTFSDASYDSNGSLLSARTVTEYDLFGLEGNVTELFTVYHRTDSGELRYAEAVGTQASSDIFGSSSAARISQYMLGIAGEAKLVASIVNGFTNELDGSIFEISQLTTYHYDAQGVVLGAAGSSSRSGFDIFLNYSQRLLENIYRIINGEARIGYSISRDDDDDTPLIPFGSGPTHVAGDQGITGAAADFLQNPDDYNITEYTIGFVTIRVYKRKDAEDPDEIAGVVIDFAGTPVVLTDVTEFTESGGVITVEGGSGESQYKYVVTQVGDAVVATRFKVTFEDTDDDPDTADERVETETQVIESIQGVAGLPITTYHTITFEDTDDDPNTADERVDTVAKVVYGMGLVSVTVHYTDNQVNGRVTISGPGYSTTLENVETVDTLVADEITLSGSGFNVVVSEDAAGRTVIEKRFSGTPDQNETVILQQLTRGDQVINVAVIQDHEGKVTRVTYTDDETGIAWFSIHAVWDVDDNGTPDDATDDTVTARVVVKGPSGSTLVYLEEVTAIAFSASDPEAIEIIRTDGIHAVTFSADGIATITETADDGSSVQAITTFRDDEGVMTTLYTDSLGNITRTIRVEEGEFVTRVVTYRGAYSPSGSNLIEAEDIFGFGFIRTDKYTDADGNLVWVNDVTGEVYRGDAPPEGYRRVATQRTIQYINYDTGAASQIVRITYDYHDTAITDPAGNTMHVYMESYAPNGATTTVLELQRDAQGQIDWARRQVTT